MSKEFEVDGITYRPPTGEVPRMGPRSALCSGEDGGDHADHLYNGQSYSWSYTEFNHWLPEEDTTIRWIHGLDLTSPEKGE